MGDKNAQKCSEGNTETSAHFLWNSGGTGRHRSWCFTSFKTDDDGKLLLPTFDDKIKYLLYAEEICPKTQKRHIQGYCYSFDDISFKTLQKRLRLGKIHCEIAMGNLSDNKDYIIGPWESKDGKKTKPYNELYVEFGSPPRQGRRTDLEELQDSIMTGKKTVRDIICAKPMMYHQYGRTLEKIEDIAMSKLFRNWETKGLWIHGESGSGKSETAFKNFSPETHYRLPDDGGWWDKYSRLKKVLEGS